MSQWNSFESIIEGLQDDPRFDPRPEVSLQSVTFTASPNPTIYIDPKLFDL